VLREWLAEITEAQAEALLYDWRFWARPEQIHPRGDWYVWLFMGGRGSGKTRAGAEWVREQIELVPSVAIVGRTAHDVNQTMISGRSGLMKVFPPHQQPKHEPTKRMITFHNGAVAYAYTAYEPDELRGPQHGAAWCDELAAWRYLQATWDNIEYGLRDAPNPHIMITSTPRTITFLKHLIAQAETGSGSVVMSRSSLYANAANLPARYVQRIRERFEGTAYARQEIYGELIEDNPSALWTRDVIDRNRVFKAPELVHILVAVDVATTSNEYSDETGIVVGGKGVDGDGYILDDATCTMAKPHEWAMAAIAEYHKYQANAIVAETNQGGEMIAATIHAIDPTVPVVSVRASRGKRTRAEPVAAMDIQGHIHHVGRFPELEDQMCQWVGDGSDRHSPDRLDARVWCISKLFNIAEKEKALTYDHMIVYDAYQDVAGGQVIGQFDGM